MLTLYLRREPDTDPILVKGLKIEGSKDTPESLFPRVRQVSVYRDAEATDLVYTLYGPRPRYDRRHKWVMFNCCRYRAVWLPDWTPPKT